MLLSLLGVAVSSAQEAPSGIRTTQRLEPCFALDEADIRSDINNLSQQFFAEEVNAVDLTRIVDRKWFELGMPNLLQTEVNKAIDSVRADTGWTRRFTSSFSPAQTTELAEQIANRAFSSEVFRSRLETLASEVAADFTGSFTTVAARSASATTACLQGYLGNVYGGAISSAFEQELRAQVEETGVDALAQDVQPGSVAGARTGIGVATIAGSYIARTVAQRLSVQLSRRIAGNIAARILGRAGTSVIPVVGWVIGGSFIVWDVASSAVRGPFPAIRRQLSGEETQRQIQKEIIASLREDLPEVSAELSAGISAEIYTQWQRFTQSFQDVLTLAEESAVFRQALADISEEDFYTLASIVQLAPQQEVVQAAQDGRLNRVLLLSDAAIEILETQPSLETVLAWSDISGNNLEQVVNYEIYRHKDPSDFTQRSLRRLLATDNLHTVSALILLSKDEMDALLQLSGATLNALAGQLDMQDFSTVAWYADALEPEARDAFLVRLLEHPPRLEKFVPQMVRNAVAGSREPLRAVEMVGSEPSFGIMGADLLQSFGADLTTVIAGTVNARLLLVKYNLGTLLLLSTFTVIFVVVIIALLLRLLRRHTKAKERNI